MWFWVITGFGFLFSLRAVRARTGEKRTGLSMRGLLRETLDLLLSLLLLVTLCDIGRAWEKSAAQFQELDFLILWAAAYVIGGYQKKSDLFFIGLATLAYGVVTAYPGPVAQFSLAAALVFGIFVFQAAFKGLRYALLFSRVPEPVKGWPVLCLLAFCVAVVLSGFAALIF